MGRFIDGEERRQSEIPPVRWTTTRRGQPGAGRRSFNRRTREPGTLGFARSESESTGRPAYDPATLLKLYLYAQFTCVPSNCRLEREAQVPLAGHHPCATHVPRTHREPVGTTVTSGVTHCD